MLADFLDYIAGYYKITGDGGERLLNCMMKRGIDYRRLRCDEEGRLHFILSRANRRKLKKTDFAFSSELAGLPAHILRYRKRPGILAGAILFALLLKLSTMFVWNLDVEGNTTIPEEDILATLEELGCAPGVYIPTIDYYSICTEFLLARQDVAWVSVNMEGSVGHVVIRETLPAKREASVVQPANIIAERDGYVRQVTVYNGRAEVKYDMPVKKGELLISGVVENKDTSTRLERASGIVMAETERTFEIKIPLTQTVKKKNSRIYEEKTLKIFGKIINLFINSSIPDWKYDKIERVERVILFEDIELPITLRTTSYVGYDEGERTLTEEEAREAAEAELAGQLAGISDGELLRLSRQYGVEDGMLILRASATMLEDIGEAVGITADESLSYAQTEE